MLETVDLAPRDAILGLTVAFNEDPRSEKVNLSVGVYQDEHGKTPTLGSVVEAENILAAGPSNKAYLPISGSPGYSEVVQELVFGPEYQTAGHLAGAHTPGGTGGLRVAADFLHANFPQATVWLSEPTWPNHPSVFAAAEVPTKTYPYFDQQTNSLAFEQMLAAIEKMPAGDVILLHGCCHNPTGIDPTAKEWQQIVQAVAKRGLLPFLDFAYQGFGDGLDEDAAGVREFRNAGGDLIVCSSFSKNFGLYRERVGALSIACATNDAATAVQSQINRAIRANYSNPPAHGAAIVETILRDQNLRETWEKELSAMRDRINGMRQQLVDSLEAKGVPGDYSFITRQRGMFSFSGLTKDQVEQLREQYAIYIVGSGRINVAGLTPANIDRVTEAIGAVVSKSA
ncbi:amino acid aminotransferase [Bythopirellula goksoeyrii]|uniref:Aminotransferase n=1 Tax=Bythopirellula goksoeyrii TaxID=1400387 RepID=A0A5B9Q7E6_9BACT|nr:amino acid aminotransferase [Bythopirellula goksoeyrii]QEG33599.1 Aspartate aminotransferase [Bythopirellula goksoeyrii]